ncbi:hypothetical protein HYW74_02645 [Candidatus Pacearchaeota archaeon]|nr:hypothetical protein [Candidatus Pacearchaeota archaeon]
MVNIWNPDYAGNPDNAFYVHSSRLVGMDWKEFRKMYGGLNEEVRKEFDSYLLQVEHMKTWEYLRMLDQHEKSRGKRIFIKFGCLEGCVA